MWFQNKLRVSLCVSNIFDSPATRKYETIEHVNRKTIYKLVWHEFNTAHNSPAKPNTEASLHEGVS